MDSSYLPALKRRKKRKKGKYEAHVFNLHDVAIELNLPYQIVNSRFKKVKPDIKVQYRCKRNRFFNAVEICKWAKLEWPDRLTHLKLENNNDTR